MKFFFINNISDVAFQHEENSLFLLSDIRHLEIEYDNNEKILSELKLESFEYMKGHKTKWRLGKALFMNYSGSILFFQAAMEATINDVYERLINGNNSYSCKAIKLIKDDNDVQNNIQKIQDKKIVPFKDKWEKLLKALKMDKASFEDYYEKIYKPYRNLIAHPEKIKKASTIMDLNNLSFNLLYEGFKYGWDSYSQLSLGLGIPHDKDSWNKLCSKYELPILE